MIPQRDFRAFCICNFFSLFFNNLLTFHLVEAV